jgi:hypothetical protein
MPVQARSTGKDRRVTRFTDDRGNLHEDLATRAFRASLATFKRLGVPAVMLAENGSALPVDTSPGSRWNQARDPEGCVADLLHQVLIYSRGGVPNGGSREFWPVTPPKHQRECLPEIFAAIDALYLILDQLAGIEPSEAVDAAMPYAAVELGRLTGDGSVPVSYKLPAYVAGYVDRRGPKREYVYDEHWADGASNRREVAEPEAIARQPEPATAAEYAPAVLDLDAKRERLRSLLMGKGTWSWMYWEGITKLDEAGVDGWYRREFGRDED